jgi:hypothetical protein
MTRSVNRVTFAGTVAWGRAVMSAGNVAGRYSAIA